MALNDIAVGPNFHELSALKIWKKTNSTACMYVGIVV